MARIRLLEIDRFRGINHLRWKPSPGVNCLIGGGDAGKSTILDALELVLSPRRGLTFSDTDFYRLDPRQPLCIQATIGELPAELTELTCYGSFLRGWNVATGELVDEPDEGLETVISLRLQVGAGLEGEWTLFSDRADDGSHRDLRYEDRLTLAPTRLGSNAAQHLNWGRYSVLNRLSEDRPQLRNALADAARAARNAFGAEGAAPLHATLQLVGEVAQEVGVGVGNEVLALLDMYAVSLTTTGIGLHDAERVPLRCLGTGSARLLAAGLQRRASGTSRLTLVDEVELGLEPFRIARLLNVLGTCEVVPPLQVFMATHSAVVLRELGASALSVVYATNDGHRELRAVGGEESAQKAVRACAEAFFAPTIAVCEGKTEVGLLRGLDRYWSANGRESFAARGVMPADGESTDSAAARALIFANAGYRTCLFRDSDRNLPQGTADAVRHAGISDFSWPGNCNTESQLFRDCPRRVLGPLIQIAIQTKGLDAIDAHLRNASAGTATSRNLLDMEDARARDWLASAAHDGNWYRLIEPAERVGFEVVGPAFEEFGNQFRSNIVAFRAWVDGG